MAYKYSSKEKLRNYISDLFDDGKRCFSQLNYEEKAVATGLVMGTFNDSDRLEFVTQSDPVDEMTMALAHYLENFQYSSVDKYKESEQEFLKSISNCAICHSEYFINEIFEDLIDKDSIYIQEQLGETSWKDEPIGESLMPF